jgi:hypothetical protein
VPGIRAAGIATANRASGSADANLYRGPAVLANVVIGSNLGSFRVRLVDFRPCR